MPKLRTALIAKAIPIALLAAVMAASSLIKPVSIPMINTALCGSAGYGALPAVDSLGITIGSTGGGTQFMVRGCGFTGATSVTFGGTPAAAFEVASDAAIAVTSPPHATGVVYVTVTTPLGTSPSQPEDQFTYVTPGTPCSSVSLTANPPSPQISDTEIYFFGSAVGCPTPMYEFWMRPASQSNWQMVQAYGLSSFAWFSGGAPTGTVYFGVWARDAASTAAYDTFTSIPYQVTVVPCSSVSITASPASPQDANTTITFAATAANCLMPKYQFLMRTASGPWQVILGYDQGQYFPPFHEPPPCGPTGSGCYYWSTSGAPAGTYYFGVWAKDRSSTAAYDAVASMPYTIASNCSSSTITAAPTTVSSGTHVAVTATAAGPGCANPLYEFWLRPASSSVWQMVQAYGWSNTYNWNSTGAASGTVYLGVHVKDYFSGASYDAVSSTPVAVTASTCSAVSITASPTTVAHSGSNGTHVTVTATGSGCTNSALYEFWLRPANSSTWQLVQPYGASNTYDWNSTGAAVGTVYLGVHVKDAGSGAAYDAVASASVSVT
jgi:hypothetical protein